mmetsp:Transcript_9128/g.28478  ORF Transcript_9128/g.28478 Transcript_9128/m.28478 type:complete len:302 (+) Transcript_9128:1236-2141(+)
MTKRAKPLTVGSAAETRRQSHAHMPPSRSNDAISSSMTLPSCRAWNSSHRPFKPFSACVASPKLRPSRTSRASNSPTATFTNASCDTKSLLSSRFLSAAALAAAKCSTTAPSKPRMRSSDTTLNAHCPTLVSMPSRSPAGVAATAAAAMASSAMAAKLLRPRSPKKSASVRPQVARSERARVSTALPAARHKAGLPACASPPAARQRARARSTFTAAALQGGSELGLPPPLSLLGATAWSSTSLRKARAKSSHTNIRSACLAPAEMPSPSVVREACARPSSAFSTAGSCSGAKPPGSAVVS